MIKQKEIKGIGSELEMLEYIHSVLQENDAYYKRHTGDHCGMTETAIYFVEELREPYFRSIAYVNGEKDYPNKLQKNVFVHE